MTRTPCILTRLSAAFLAAPAAALHGNGEIGTTHIGPMTLYIDDRTPGAGDTDTWSYLESNDVEELQSGDQIDPMRTGGRSLLEPCLHDACAHSSPGTLIA